MYVVSETMLLFTVFTAADTLIRDIHFSACLSLIKQHLSCIDMLCMILYFVFDIISLINIKIVPHCHTYALKMFQPMVRSKMDQLSSLV